MKLSASLTLLLLAGETTKTTWAKCDDENGYEVWQQRPIDDAKVQFEGVVNCVTKTYTLKYSFVPDQNLPFINNITKTDWNGNIANPNKTEICQAEGLGPGLTEHVPAGTHVGQNVHYTDYSYSYETSNSIQDATGFKLLTIGAAPCGTPTQAYPHYSVHFYTIDANARKKMQCRSNGGYFCLNATSQCSKSGEKFNLDGEGIEKCADGSYANVPPGFQWTVDGNPSIGINAASPGMGLHGLIPSELGGNYEDPLLLMVQYDSTIVANHIVLWGGLPLGQNNPGGRYSWSKNTTYNCQDTKKYPTLPTTTSVEYNNRKRRTYISIMGPTDKCKDSFRETYGLPTKAGKNTKRD